MSSESERQSIVRSNSRAADFRSKKNSPDRRRKFFRVIAKHAYPRKTAHEIRVLTKGKYGVRTIYDWMAGRSEAPMAVCIGLLHDILDN